MKTRHLFVLLSLLLPGVPPASGHKNAVEVDGFYEPAIERAIHKGCGGGASGTIVFRKGTYEISRGVHIPDHCTLEAERPQQVVLHITNNDYGLYIEGDNVTIQGFVFDGGGIISNQTSTSKPQLNVSILDNTIQNISSGKYGIASNGYWKGFLISHNRFSSISSIPWQQVSTKTVVEGGTPYDGLGINNVNGMDETKIDHNTFDHILGDAIHVMFNWTFGKAPGTYSRASGNDISYNVFHDLHRMAIEIQGTSGNCPGGCEWSAAAHIEGLTIKGNFNYHQYLPWYDEMGFSLVPDGATRPLFLNNTVVYGETPYSCGEGSNAFENSGDGAILQGNVIASASSCAKNWPQYFETGTISAGATVTHQNNLLCGATAGGAHYFAWEGKNKHTGYGSFGDTVDRYNFINATCPNPNDPSASMLDLHFLGRQEQGPSRFEKNWRLYVTDQISVVSVSFFLDGSKVPFATQEIQDLNTNFSNDRRWLYHVALDTAKLADGSHSLTAAATDVSGAVRSVTEQFAVNKRIS